MIMSLMEREIINKNEVTLKKINASDYNIIFGMENAEVNLSYLITINLFKLIYDLNVDLFDTIQIEKINDSEATIFILFKDLLNDIGYAHFYFYFHIKQDLLASQFIITPLSRPEHIIGEPIAPQIAQHIAQQIAQPIAQQKSIEISKCILNYTILNAHKIQFNIDVSLTSPSESSIIEKIICNILYKIINRVKQFVSTIKYNV